MNPSPRHPIKALAVLCLALVLVHGAGAHVLHAIDGDDEDTVVEVSHGIHLGHGVHVQHHGDQIRIDVGADDDDDANGPGDDPVIDIDLDDDDWS